MDLSVTTPAHLTWLLNSLHEVRYAGWGSDAPCALPTQPGATVAPDRVAAFLCQRIVALCPAVESRKDTLLQLLCGETARHLIADTFWILYLEFFALTDGVARVTALRHVVATLLDELHATTEEHENDEILTDPRACQIIDTALRSGVQQGSALTQGFLSACGFVTMDVTGVQTSSSGASSSQKTTAINVAKVPLPHHLTPKILEDNDDFGVMKRKSGGSRSGQHSPTSSQRSSSVCSTTGGGEHQKSAFAGAGAAGAGDSSTRRDSVASEFSSPTTFTRSDSELREQRKILRNRSKSVAEDSPEVLLQLQEYKEHQREENTEHILKKMAARRGSASVNNTSRATSRASSRSSSKYGGGSGSDGDGTDSIASSTLITTRKSLRKKVRLNSRASSLFLGECNQPEVTPKTILQLVTSMGTSFSAATIKATAGNVPHTVGVGMSSSSSSPVIGGGSSLPQQQQQQQQKLAPITVTEIDAPMVTSPSAAVASPPFSSPSAAPNNSTPATTSNNNNNSSSSSSQFGMNRAVLEEIVRAKIQDYQVKPYSGRTETTAALRLLRDASLLEKIQCRKLLMDKMISSVDAEAITKKRGIVLAAVELVAEEQNRLFSRLSQNFAALMKRLSPRGHASSFSVPRDMVLPFISDALAQTFCALVFDVCPHLRAELKLDTRRAVKRHVSFWFDGVDNDHVANWGWHWARPKLLHRHGAEKTTCGGVVVGQSESQQQQMLQNAQRNLSPGQASLQVSPMMRNLRGGAAAGAAGAAGATSPQYGALPSPGASTSAHFPPPPGMSSSSGGGFGSSSSQRRRSPRKRRPGTSSASASSSFRGGGGPALGTMTAAQQQAQQNQQLSTFAGGITVIPPPRNARAELLKTFTRVEERRRHELDEEREVKRRIEEEEKQTQRDLDAFGGRLTTPVLVSSASVSFAGGGGVQREDSGLGSPAVEPTADGDKIQMPSAIVEKKNSGITRSGSNNFNPSPLKLPSPAHQPLAPGPRPATTTSSGPVSPLCEPLPPPPPRRPTIADSTSKSSAPIPHPPRRNARSPPSPSSSSRPGSKKTRGRSPNRNSTKRKSVAQLDQERHQTQVVVIRQRLDAVQEILMHQQALRQQLDEKEKHRRKFMTAAAIEKEEQDKLKAKQAEEKKAAEEQQKARDHAALQHAFGKSSVFVQAPNTARGAGLSREQQKRLSYAGEELFANANGDDDQQPFSSSSNNNKRSRSARSNNHHRPRSRFHYREPTDRVQRHLQEVHDYQEAMEAQHPGEFKFQPRRKLLSVDEEAALMEEQQELLQLLARESAEVAESYQKLMMEELAAMGGAHSPASTHLGDDDDDDEQQQKLQKKRFGAAGESRGMQVGAKDVVRSLEAADRKAQERRKQTQRDSVGTRSYTAARTSSALSSKANKLAQANRLIRTHRFAPCNQPDQPWHRFGALQRPPPSAVSALTQGHDFYAEGEFAMGLLSPVMERFCEEQRMASAKEVGLHFPSRMLWSFMVKGRSGGGGGASPPH